MRRDRTSSSIPTAVAIPLAFGLGWLLLELACIAVRAPVFEPGETLRRLARLRPFQLGLFAVLSAALALATRTLALAAVALGWVSLGPPPWCSWGPGWPLAATGPGT